MKEGDLLQVTQLVTKRPEYSAEGVSNFMLYNDVDAFLKESFPSQKYF